MSEDLGDLPEPTTDPPELFPGGVDSLQDEDKYGDIPVEPVIRDLPTASNPAANEVAPDALRSTEDTGDVTSDGASDHDVEAPA